MSVDLEFFDIQSVSAVLNSVSEMTGLSFSLYDSTGIMLFQTCKKGALTTEDHEGFIRDNIGKVVIRRDATIILSPSNQHHLFIPINIRGIVLVLVSSALHHDYASIQKFAVNIKSLIETILLNLYEKNLINKRYLWTKTLIDVVSGIHAPVPLKDVYSLILDTVIFLFNFETVSVMVKDKGIFRTIMAAGDLKEDIRHSFFRGSERLISRSVGECKPVFTNDVSELSRLGFPESITSLHIFPIMCMDYVHGMLIVYNSIIPKDIVSSIMEFCRLSCLIIKSLKIQDAYDHCVNDMMSLHMALVKMVSQFQNSGSIYDAVVDSATDLIKAEKGSLMLPEEDALSIKAIKGINKWLAQDIKVKIGEGIAGTVFKSGNPLLVKDVESVKLPFIKTRRHYKTNSFISVPLKFASEITGVLNVADKITGDEFTERDLNLLSYFASYSSIALKAYNYHLLAEQMKEFSITDPLTQLFNRRYLYERFNEEIHRSERHNLIFSFVIFDIDDFKMFNDTEGHLAGDYILKEVAQIARRSLRANDVICRFGGEEFAILMPQTDRQVAYIVAERIRNNICKTLSYKWEKFPKGCITISTGISFFPECGMSIEQLIKSADEALYKAKTSGKNMTVFYESEI